MPDQDLLKDAQLVAAWAKGVLENTDPNDDDSYFNDHARECAESIAFDNRRDEVVAAIARIEAEKGKDDA